MTNSKAIYYLEQLKNYTPLLTEEDTAIEMAISVLEKRYGKKPKKAYAWWGVEFLRRGWNGRNLV